MQKTFGIAADTAHRVLVCHDHGGVFMSDDFQSPLTFFGTTPGFAFVRQPEINSIAERCIPSHHHVEGSIGFAVLWVSH